MTEQKKSVFDKNAIKDAVHESAEKLENVTHDAKEQVLDVVAETQEKLQTEAKQLNAIYRDWETKLRIILNILICINGTLSSTDSSIGFFLFILLK